MAAARAFGPVRVDPEVAAVIAALDPADLGDEELDALLVAAGLAGRADEAGGEIALPDRMAEVNAMLDLATPEMREALMIAFLDRLSRPSS